MNGSNPSNNGQDDNVFSSLPSDVLKDRIFAFVGPFQYRFVGGVCRSFRDAYRTTFPSLTTYYNVSTMKHAKFCFQGTSKQERKLLRRLAARKAWYHMIRLTNWNEVDWKLLQYFKYEFRCPWEAFIVANVTDTRTCSIAARNGDLKALQFARAMGCPWNEDTIIQATINGHEEVLNWALENGCPQHKNPFFSAVYRFVGGVARHVRESYHMNFPEKFFGYDMSTMKSAKISFEGAPEIIKPLLQHCATMQAWYWFVCMDDLNKENLTLLRWTKVTFQCPWGTLVAATFTHYETCSIAARNGDLKMLQIARAYGCLWFEDVCKEAAQNGHLDILQWAHENGCPWNAGVCCVAAKNCRFDILQWAHENGCPLCADVLY
jgi:hypothetical protein